MPVKASLYASIYSTRKRQQPQFPKAKVHIRKKAPSKLPFRSPAAHTRPGPKRLPRALLVPLHPPPHRVPLQTAPERERHRRQPPVRRLRVRPVHERIDAREVQRRGLVGQTAREEHDPRDADGQGPHERGRGGFCDLVCGCARPRGMLEPRLRERGLDECS